MSRGRREGTNHDLVVRVEPGLKRRGHAPQRGGDQFPAWQESDAAAVKVSIDIRIGGLRADDHRRARRDQRLRALQNDPRGDGESRVARVVRRPRGSEEAAGEGESRDRKPGEDGRSGE